MNKFLAGILIVSVFGLSQSSWSEELDAYSQEALEKTTNLMNNPTERHEANSKDSKALEVDHNVQNLMGNKENMNEVYNLSAEIFKDQTHKAGGDVEKIKVQMKDANCNPAAFGNQLTPEQRQRIRELASKIEERQSNSIGTAPK